MFINLQFEEKQKQKGDDLFKTYKTKLEEDIETSFSLFQQENENKRKFVEVSPKVIDLHEQFY